MKFMGDIWRLGVTVFAVIAIVTVLILWLVPVMSATYTEEEPYQTTETYVEKEPYTDTETYTEMEPYTTTETYYEKEPYTTTETYYEKEPYETTEYVSETYTYTEDIPYTKISDECHSWGWLSDGCDCNVTIRNEDSSHGGTFRAKFKIQLNGGATTYISSSKYIAPGQTETITAKYSGADIELYWHPTITAPTKEVIGTHDVPKTVTKYRNVSKTREVTKYHDVAKTREVTKYQEVEKTREVTKYKDVEKTRDVLKIHEVEKTKTIPLFEYWFDYP